MGSAIVDCGPGAVRVVLLFALFLLAACGVGLADPAAGAAATKEIKIKAQYEAPSCPSGKGSMQPLPRAKLLVEFGSRTIRDRLNDQGVANLKLKGKARELKAKVVLDGDLLAVSPYDKDAPYSYVDGLKLTDKKTYGLKIQELEKAGAASAWAILSRGAKVGQAAAPAGIDLGKVIARYDSGRGPTAGLPDLPGSETAYDADKSEILIDSRTRADEFEPWVLNHEYGHHVLEKVANPGPDAAGAHDFERSYPDQPALPWSEGFAHAFAAIVAKNPVLGTLCRTGVNIGASPAVPASKNEPWLNQYHEISIAGVLWGLTTHFGGGNQQAGLKPLLKALHAFWGNYGGPTSLREALDALVEGGLEKGSAAEHVAIAQRFLDQGVYWRVTANAAAADFREAGSQADYELHLDLEGPGPYGACESTIDDGGPEFALTGMLLTELDTWIGEIGAEGGLPYTSRDDCLVFGADGKQPYDGVAGGAFWLHLPYLARQVHHSGTFSLGATWLCSDAQVEDPEPKDICTSDRLYQIGFAAGSRPGVLSNVSLPRGGRVELLRFDATGKECTFVPTGEDCSF